MTSYLSNKLKDNFKIIGLYVFSVLCLGLFFYMDNSQELKELIEKADRVKTDWGFGFYAIIGLIKMASLIAGVIIPLMLTFMIIRQRIKKMRLNSTAIK